MESTYGEVILRGIPAAPGIAIGCTYLYVKDIPSIVVRELSTDEIGQEIARLRSALARSEKELGKILAFAQLKLGDAKAKIFDAQVMILHDPYLLEALERRIRSERKNAEYIVSTEVEKYEQLMLAAHDDYMHERAHDVDDLKNRIIRNLQEDKLVSRLEGSPIIVSRALTPTDTMILSRNDILGYATELGGITSHAALLARSLKLPAVVGLRGVTKNLATGDHVIIDGFAGAFVIRPTKEREEEYMAKRERFLQFEARLAGLKDLPPETTDGHKITISANINFEEEIEFVHLQGGRGIGLYRTETVLFGRDNLPSEEEQFEDYKKIADRIYPHTVVMRTFDVGGDKISTQMSKEDNPFLGWRGIRVSLDQPEIFLIQLRAILRASTRKNVSIMFPMIGSASEVRRAKEYVAMAKTELKARKLKFDDKIPLGIMVEVPSAVLLADELANEVDFFSIGTNDLVQYLLAVDRGNDAVAKLYSEFHPAVLRSVKAVIDAAHKHGKNVAMCGEMAGNPLAAILLVGMGLVEFSVIPSVLPEIKKIVRSVSLKHARQLAKTALSLATQKEVEDFLISDFHTSCPDVPLVQDNL